MSATEDADSSSYGLLRLIPVFALRRAAVEVDPDGGFRSLDGDALRAKIQTKRVLSPHQIRELFEKWRYGERPGFVLALFLRDFHPPAQLKDVIQTALAERFEGPCPVALLDEDRTFDRDTVEMSLRFEHTHHYIDTEEEPRALQEIRYGFLWVDAAHRFAAVGGTEDVAGAVLAALGIVVQQQPVRVSISKDALDKHFPLSAISSIAHVDPATGIKHRVSGPALKEAIPVFREISRRDKDEFRLGALYGQELQDGRRINVGVNAPLGRMYLTGVVSATDVRKWALPTLKELAGALHELRKAHPDAFNAVVRATTGLTDVPERYAPLIQAVLLALVESRLANVSEFPVSTDAAGLGESLPKKFGELRCFPQCARCDEPVGVTCDTCHEGGVRLVNGRVECVTCGISGTLECDKGHRPSQTALHEGLHFVFGPAMLTALSQGIASLGFDAIDRTREVLSIHGKTLWRIDKGLIRDGVYTCVYVDLANSTQFLRHDPDGHGRAVSGLRDVIQSTAARYDGRYAQDTGDGAFALFPNADDALRAAKTMASSVAKTKEIPAQNRPRIGVGTGRVLGKGGYFTGLAINIAARLQEKSKDGGGILIDEATSVAVSLRLPRIAALAGLHGLEEESGGYYRLPAHLPPAPKQFAS